MRRAPTFCVVCVFWGSKHFRPATNAARKTSARSGSKNWVDKMFLLCALPPMFDPDEIAVRQAASARHMSERLTALAERVFVQAEAAVEPEAVQAAALTVEKLYRGVRLCMSFESRVVREHRRASREVEADVQKVRDDVRAKGIARIENAASATFHAEYEADCETSADTEDTLRTLVRHIAALSDAVTGAATSIDPDGDFATQVEELRQTALLIAKINALQAPVPEPEPPRRRGRTWGPSG